MLDEIRKIWNPEAIYDITDIKATVTWEYYFSKLFPEHRFTLYWVGRLNQKEKRRLLFMPSNDEHYRMFRLYLELFSFYYQDGKVEMLICNRISDESRAEIEGKHPEGDWLAAVYGEPQNGEIAVNFVSKTFEELNLVKAREFTKEEMDAINGGELLKQIEQKKREIKELEAKVG